MGVLAAMLIGLEKTVDAASVDRNFESMAKGMNTLGLAMAISISATLAIIVFGAVMYAREFRKVERRIEALETRLHERDPVESRTSL